MASQFKPKRFETLQNVVTDGLESSLQPSDSGASTAPWNQLLEKSIPELASVGAVRPPSQAEHQEIETGFVIIDGVRTSLAPDQVEQTLLLSRILNVSERYAASLLLIARAERGRWGRGAVHTACLLYHREKLALLNTLKALLAALLDARSQEQTDFAERIEPVLDNLVTLDVSLPAGTTRLIPSLLAMLDSAEPQRAFLRGEGFGQLPDGFVDETTISLALEEQEAAHILVLLAFSGLMYPSDVFALLSWLQRVNPTKYVYDTEDPVDPSAFGTRTILVLTAALATLELPGPWVEGEDTVQEVTRIVSSKQDWKTPSLASTLSLQWVLTLAQRMPAAPSVEAKSKAERLQFLAVDTIQSGVFAFLENDVLSFRKRDSWNRVPNPIELDTVFQGYVLDHIERLVLGVTDMMLPLLKHIHSQAGANKIDPVAQLFLLITTLCSDRPESGLAFWADASGRPNRFLLWAIESRTPQNRLPLLNMLAALVSGPRSAIQAHNLLSHLDEGGNRMLRWSDLFAWIEHYIALYQKASAPREIPSEEAEQFVAFLSLLRNVVYHSQVARTALYERSDSQAIHHIFRLTLLPVPGEVKAVLYEVLAAFARRDNSGTETITADIWALLSATDVLGTGKSAYNSALGRNVAAAGAIYELERVEAERGLYPATRALVHLLTAVIPFVPEGTDTFVNFVIHHVYLEESRRFHADEEDEYELQVACLEFFSRCLTEFRLDPTLLDLGLASPPELAPGFLIIRNILQNEPLAKAIFATIEKVPYGLSNMPPPPIRHIKLAMQCLKRVFEVQNAFLQGFLPLLTRDGTDGARLGELSDYAPLDQHLLFSHQTVVEIALYISSSSVEVAMLSIQLLGYLASSASFSAQDRFSLPGGRKKLNRLAGLLEMTGETEKMRAAYIERLLKPSEGDSAEGQGEPNSSASKPSIRIAILDFLINHLSLEPPNIAHLLLGYDISTSAIEAPPLPDSSAPSAPETVLSAVMSLVSVDRPGALYAFLEQDPVLAERCFQLLLDLCSDPYTSSATLQYLRVHENFMVRLPPVIPFEPFVDPKGVGEVIGPDRSVRTSVEAAAANLRIKASLLEIIAIQIHTVTNAGQADLAAPLVNMLMGPKSVQPLAELLLDSLNFVWTDDRDALRAQMTVLATLNDDLARSEGDQEFDLDKARDTIVLARKELQSNAGLNDQGSRDAFEADAARWIEWMAAQNAHRSIREARLLALQNWGHALGMVLSRCSSWFNTQERDAVLFSLLLTLLPLMNTESDAAYRDTISSIVLELVAAVRLIAKEQAERYSPPSPERILDTLRLLLAAILQPEHTTVARGNLYSALINLLQFVQQEDASTGSDEWDIPDDASLAGSTLSVTSTRASILLHVRAALNERAEQVVARLAKDALDASDVWKAVSYTLLDKLTELEGPRWVRPSRVLDVLFTHGYLKSMVSALRDSDLALQECLRPDPATLNALYVYQAQMAFFVRLATSRKGVEALLDLGLINILAQADFIAASPEVGQDFTDMEGFLPAARERYAELLTPALELAATMFSISPVANDPISALLANQGESLAELLQGLLANEVTIGQIEQAHLLVVLLNLRAAKIHHPLPSHAPNYHHQLLSVAAAFLAKNGWAHRVVAANETEREQTRQGAPDGQTRFDRRVQLAVERLQRALLGYLETVSRPSSSRGAVAASIRPVLTSATSLLPTYGRSLQRGTTLPSLGTATQALEEEFDKLSARIGLLAKVGTAAASPETARADELKELLGAEGQGTAPQLTSRLLQRERGLKVAIGNSLGVVELLLVLVCRHFDFYLGLPEAPAGESGRSSLPASAPGGKADKPLLIQFGLDKVGTLMDRVMEIALSPDQVHGAPERCGFIEMLVRKMQATLIEARAADAPSA